MEVSKKCMMPFQGQMSIGEFRADASEFQVHGVTSSQDESKIWHFLAQSRPSPFNFGHQAAHGASKQRGGGVASHRSSLTQLRNNRIQVGLRQVGRAVRHCGQAHLEPRRNGPADVCAAIEEVHGHACACVYDEPWLGGVF